MDKKWNYVIWVMLAIWMVLVVGMGLVVVVHAQITPGTTSSKTLDGVGNKITSTVVGPARGLDVNVIATTGGGGVSYLDADAIVNQTTTAVHGQTYMYNGATWDRVRGSIAGGLQVNCVTGCSGGSSTPTDAFANPTTAGLSQSFGMVYNGATWDLMRGTIAGGVLTNISNASLAVTGTFFQATQPVSGTVAVSNAFLLDATFTGRFPAAYVDADTIANQTTTAVHGQCYLYNGATWDRCRGAIATGMLVNISNASIAVTGTVAVSNSFLLDATFTGRFAAAYVDADTIANQTTTAVHGQLYGYNGATWDRLRSTIAGGLLVDVSDAFALDATITNRFPAGSTPADNESNAITATRFGNYNFVFDGVAWDRWTGAVTQSGTWNIGTVTTVTSITNPVTITDGAGALNVIVDSGTLTAVTSITNPVTVTDGAGALNVIVDSGTLTAVTSITNTVTVQGAKTNNNAAPGATNVGTLPCIATAVAPSNTEGNQTGCSQNLGGAQRVIEQNFISTANNDGSCASGAASFTAIASNASRTWLAVWASPANTDDVYLKLGATATAADARFAPGQPLNFTSGRIYTGIIDAFPASGTQAVCVMELN